VNRRDPKAPARQSSKVEAEEAIKGVSLHRVAPTAHAVFHALRTIGLNIPRLQRLLAQCSTEVGLVQARPTQIMRSKRANKLHLSLKPNSHEGKRNGRTEPTPATPKAVCVTYSGVGAPRHSVQVARVWSTILVANTSSLCGLRPPLPVMRIAGPAVLAVITVP
jgi:hypothetical protein